MIQDILDGFEQLHIVVVGDVMLDKYSWGEVERISPEAPVPVVSIRKSETRLGGAANVALNCKALGAKVCMASVIGQDPDGQYLKYLLENQGIDTGLLLFSDDRVTTSKTRILARNQQMIRLDSEESTALNVRDEHGFIDATLRYLQIQKPDVVIFEDYNKGVLKDNIIQKIIGHCRSLGILVAVDPKKDNFLTYKGATIFKPNLKEVREGLHMAIPVVDLLALDAAHRALSEHLGDIISLITLSERGIYYHQPGNGGKILPSHLRNIADVSGAGDTVIAVAAMVYALTKDADQMALWSNIAGGLVCEEVGVVPVDKQKLASELLLSQRRQIENQK